MQTLAGDLLLCNSAPFHLVIQRKICEGQLYLHGLLPGHENPCGSLTVGFVVLDWTAADNKRFF